LTDDQKKIFRYIIKELKEADILGNLDVYVLTTTAISIDRLAKMEQQINDDDRLLLDTHFMTAKDKYTKDFFRCCNELSLSPQARAKLSISNVNAMKESKNPLLDALDL
jgi:P27 family predicted phage terminase small subunit